MGTGTGKEIETNTDEFLGIKAQDITDVVFLTGLDSQANDIENAIENDIIAFNVSNSFTNEVFEVDFDRIVCAVVSSIKNVSHQSYKGRTFIEPSEVKKVKESLSNYNLKGEKLLAIREELEKFEEQIQINYSQKINQYSQEKAFLQEQVLMYENKKHQLVMKRASQMLWPFNDQTRAYDGKIEGLKIKIERLEQKIQFVMGMRPAADEKDILMFSEKLKQKFAQ